MIVKKHEKKQKQIGTSESNVTDEKELCYMKHFYEIQKFQICEQSSYKTLFSRRPVTVNIEYTDLKPR
jgi:hypothetical protein